MGCLLFLDIDGVLHGDATPSLARLPLFERTLRRMLDAQIVISSTWRMGRSLEELRALFHEDLRGRVCGVTPILENGLDNGGRQREIEAYLESEGLHSGNACWRALDDWPQLFSPDCNWLQCVNGLAGWTEEDSAKLLVWYTGVRLSQATARKAPAAVHRLCGQLLLPWLGLGQVPGQALQGVGIDLPRWLGPESIDFNFDGLIQPECPSGWHWTAWSPATLDGDLHFMIPTAWQTAFEGEDTMRFLKAKASRMECRITSRENWWYQAQWLFGTGEIVAFSFDPLLAPHYTVWVLIRQVDTATATAWGIYSAWDDLLVARAPMECCEVIANLVALMALVNSSPWAGWIQADREHRESRGY